MAIRIVGVDLPQNKCGEVGLTYIYGIGRSSAKKILAEAGVDPSIKVQDWTDDQAAKIREIVGAKYKVEGDLRSETQLNIKRLMDIGCYRVFVTVLVFHYVVNLPRITLVRVKVKRKLLQIRRKQRSNNQPTRGKILCSITARRLAS